MGLISDYRKFKKQNELLTFLNEFGITKDDLEYLHEAIEVVKNKKAFVLDEKQKEKIKEKQAEKMTPEQLVAQFADKVEEFYPYGRPKE